MIKKTMVGVFLALTLSLSGKVLGWVDCNWAYRSEVSITGPALTDYQVLIKLTSSDLHANYNWSLKGDELRVVDTDDLTALDFFVQSWDSAAKTAEIWVRIPSLAASSAKTVYFYYGNDAAASASNATATMTESGIKFHTRYSTANPSNKAAGFSAFNAASDNVAGYGCQMITNFTGISNKNQYTPATSSNFVAYSETYFEVLAGEEGTWSIRYGGDFGFGGGLYVDGVALEEDWNSDLWWGGSWAHVDVLQGSIDLGEGYHKLEVIGFENCCDGGITVQFKKPGGVFQTYSTANIGIVSRKCSSIEPVSSVLTQAHQAPELSIIKSSTVISDPINNTTYPKRISGARVRYTITVSNSGSPADENSIVIKDLLPSQTELLLAIDDFSFEDGVPSSNLSFTYAGAISATDDVNFTATGVAPFTYLPNPMDDIDSNINAFEMSPKGRLGCSNTDPASFSLNYDVLIN